MHIFAFRILPDLYGRDVNVARPCQMAVFNVCAFEENGIVQFLPVGLPEIGSAIENTLTATVKSDSHAMVVISGFR